METEKKSDDLINVQLPGQFHEKKPKSLMKVDFVNNTMRLNIHLLATGRQQEIEVAEHATLIQLKDAIERKCGIAQEQMRVMHNGRNLTQDGAPISSMGISEDASIVVMVKLNMYNEVAGQTRIDGASKDNYGNAVGSKFDLAKDGAFKGATIGVLHLYAFGGFDFRYPQAALQKKGFEILRWTKCPEPDELRRGLEKCCQLWMISSIDGVLEPRHMDVIKDFFEKGNGVYIWGENQPCYEDANRLGKYLIGATMSGNVPGSKVLKERPIGSNSSGFTQHLITTGLETLFEGVTVATIHQDRNFHKQQMKPLVYGSDMIDLNGKMAPNLVTAVYEQDGKRLLIDTGFTRLYVNWDSAGTDRYVSNAAAWLANYERFQDNGPGGAIGAQFRNFSSSEVSDMRKAFNLFDKSGTGYIDMRDLKQVLHSLGQEATDSEINDMLSGVVEGNPDATKVNFQEFSAMMGEEITDSDIDAEMMEAFKLFDADNSGYITAANLRQIMRNLGSQVNDKEVMEMITEADLAGDKRLNYDEFYKIMMGPGKDVSKAEKERLENRAERRHGQGTKATMAHLRAAQRWEALRNQVIKAVRRQRAENEENLTLDLNENLAGFRKQHGVFLGLAGLFTAVCVIVPLALQAQFSTMMKEAQDLRKLSHYGTMTTYLDEVLTMSGRMSALSVAEEMPREPATCTNDPNDYLCCKTWSDRVNGNGEGQIGKGDELVNVIAEIGKLEPSIKSTFDKKTAVANDNLLAREQVVDDICANARTSQTSAYSPYNTKSSYGGAAAGTEAARGARQSIGGGVQMAQDAVFDGVRFENDYFPYIKVSDWNVDTSSSSAITISSVTDSSHKLKFQATDGKVILDASECGDTCRYLGIRNVKTITDKVYSMYVKDFGKTNAPRSSAGVWTSWTTETCTEASGSPSCSMFKKAGVSENPGINTAYFIGKLDTFLRANHGEAYVRICDELAEWKYADQKVAFTSGVLEVEDLIQQEMSKFDREHWSKALRNGIVYVVFALLQGFSIFLLLLHEKRGNHIEARLAEAEERLADLKHRDWLTSEALPVLRSTIVEDIEQSWIRKEESMRMSKRNQKLPQLERTVSQEMRQTNIWTMKFKKIARLRKLQVLLQHLSVVTELLSPYKRRQFIVLIFAQVIALVCILIPAIFEITSNESVLITKEIRELQEAGDRCSYYDEVLTMSARMCILRADGIWQRRYNEAVPPMDFIVLPGGKVDRIEKVLVEEFSSGHQDGDVGNIFGRFDSSTTAANTALIENHEVPALNICADKDAETNAYDPSGCAGNKASTAAGCTEDGKAFLTAKEGLFSDTYKELKTKLMNGVEGLNSDIQRLVTYEDDNVTTRSNWNWALIVIVFILLISSLSYHMWYMYQLNNLEKQFAELHKNAMAFEQRDWLTSDALLRLRTSIIQDIRRATQRRYEEATDEQKEHIEVLDKPKDLTIPDVPITASTMRYMEHQ